MFAQKLQLFPLFMMHSNSQKSIIFNFTKEENIVTDRIQR